MPVSKMLSKSLYLRGLQCSKSLWLKKHRPDALTKPDASKLAIFKTGDEVGQLACNLFPGGKKVPYEGTTMGEKIQLTKEWIDKGVENIYEATFCDDDVLIMVDILRILEDGEVEIYEVKSSSKVKDVHIADASIQHHVLENLGYKVSDTFIVHIDSKYIRGDDLEVDKFLTLAKVSDEVKALQADIPNNIATLKQALSLNAEPVIGIGPHCQKPYSCDAMDYCWHHQGGIPEYSIFDLANLKAGKKFKLYNKGVISLNDITDLSDFSSAQQLQIAAEQTGKETINHGAIKQFLKDLSYPIYHLDFETFHPAIPCWKNSSPHQHIPYQYSIHIEHEDGKLNHKEFLETSGIDPRNGLAKRLVETIPMDATVLAYNMGFEKRVIKGLAESFSDLAPHLMNIHDNIQDLMKPFQKKDYYTAAMKGKYSIKNVLPALVPEMEKAYKDLKTVHNGRDATLIYDSLITGDHDEASQDLEESLLEYCKLDTRAMVKVLEKLKAVAG
jgi:hypothetical protein